MELFQVFRVAGQLENRWSSSGTDPPVAEPSAPVIALFSPCVTKTNLPSSSVVLAVVFSDTELDHLHTYCKGKPNYLTESREWGEHFLFCYWSVVLNTRPSSLLGWRPFFPLCDLFRIFMLILPVVFLRRFIVRTFLIWDSLLTVQNPKIENKCSPADRSYSWVCSSRLFLFAGKKLLR